MEGLFNDNGIGELEQKVESLIQTFKEMKDERERLRTRVETLETENRELGETMKGLQGEKEVIMDKVKNILEKVERIQV
jgi:predicted nuclease with TOPRIM domain